MPWIESFARSIPLPVYRFFIRREIIGFCYHTVVDTPAAHVRYLIPSKTPEQFERDLIFLKQQYTPVSYDQLWEHALHGVRLPRRAAIVTFDDGYSECFSVVRPLLLRHSIPATFFLITDSLDNRSLSFRNVASLCIATVSALNEAARQDVFRCLNEAFGQSITSLEAFSAWIKPLRFGDWAMIEAACQFIGLDVNGYLTAQQPYLNSGQVRTLQNEGFTFGAHTRHHPKLKFLPPEAITDEIVASCRAVATLTGEDTVPFAFPFSADGVARDFLARLRAENPVVGLMFDSNGVQRTGKFIQSRVIADTSTPLYFSPLQQWQPGDGESNLLGLIHRAYQDVLLWKAKRLGLS